MIEKLLRAAAISALFAACALAVACSGRIW